MARKSSKRSQKDLNGMPIEEFSDWLFKKWLTLQQRLDVWEFEQSGGYESIEPVEVKAA